MDSISWEDTSNLASFLAEQLRNLHLLPFPSVRDLIYVENEEKQDYVHGHGFLEDRTNELSIPADWKIFIRTLNQKRTDIVNRLTKWGDPIPSSLIEQVQDYIPDDFAKLFNTIQNGERLPEVFKTCTWIHSDIMDDNIIMEPCSCSDDTSGASLLNNSNVSNGELNSWRPSHILDFGNMSIGDPICDLIPLYLDIFRGDNRLLKRFLESYKLPLMCSTEQNKSVKQGSKFGRTSYLAMCYCILHDDNILGAIFSIWKELRMSKSWEDVEEAVWGDLNNYTGFS